MSWFSKFILKRFDYWRSKNSFLICRVNDQSIVFILYFLLSFLNIVRTYEVLWQDIQSIVNSRSPKFSSFIYLLFFFLRLWLSVRHKRIIRVCQLFLSRPKNTISLRSRSPLVDWKRPKPLINSKNLAEISLPCDIERGFKHFSFLF